MAAIIQCPSLAAAGGRGYRALALAALLFAFSAASVQAADPPLVELARAELMPLEPADERLFAAVAAGQVLDLGESGGGEIDASGGKDWPASRAVKLAHIAWLCTSPQAKELITSHGVRIRGGRIEQEAGAGLGAIEVLFDIELRDCYFPVGLDVSNSTVRNLDLGGSYLAGGLQADDLKIGKSLFARKCVFIGPVELRRATANGSVDLAGARVEGAVHLPNARIKGEVRCTDALLALPKGEGADEAGFSLNMDLARIGGTVSLDGTDEKSHFTAECAVRMVLAQIDGNLDCWNGAFLDAGDESLYANGLQVGGSVFLAHGFTCRGKISFRTGRVQHYLNLYELGDGKGPALGDATLDCQALHVGTLNCDTLDWVQPGRLMLNGFVYDRIELVKQEGAKEIQLPLKRTALLAWLGSQAAEPFFPQPYEQLAEVLKREGYDDEARPILIEKERQLGKRAEFGLRNVVWYGIFGPIIGYGYNPLHGLRWLAGIWVIGAALFWLASKRRLIVPVIETTADASPADRAAAVANHPPFQPLIYSLDLLAPLLELGQSRSWRLNLSAKGSNALQWYQWFHSILGWTLTTLVVAGLTGLVRS